MIVLEATLAASAALVAWIYAGYPLVLAVLARVAPAHRARTPIAPTVSVIIAAHNEEDAIAGKVKNVRASDYPADHIEIVIASDGSTDETVAAARSAGADVVLDLPRVGKIRALCAAANVATATILVFTDADSEWERATLKELVSNFADDQIGGVSGNQIPYRRAADGAVIKGEGLYWKYEHWLKKLEDRVGNTVSAAGGLYAIRRELFRPPTLLAAADDFIISSEVVRQGARLAFDERSRVRIAAPPEDGPAFRRKVRVMNGGLRGAFSLGRLLIPFAGGFYGFQVLTHKILRRFTAFFLGAMLAATVALSIADARWFAVLAPQVAFYGLATAGWLGRRRPWGRNKVLWVPYFFCLANLAAALAVVSLVRGVRFERWEPARPDTAAASG